MTKERETEREHSKSQHHSSGKKGLHSFIHKQYILGAPSPSHYPRRRDGGEGKTGKIYIDIGRENGQITKRQSTTTFLIGSPPTFNTLSPPSIRVAVRLIARLRVRRAETHRLFELRKVNLSVLIGVDLRYDLFDFLPLDVLEDRH